MIRVKIIIFFILLNLFLVKNFLFASEENIYDKIDLFGEVLNKINKEYVEEIDQSEAMDAAINGVLQSLDPYSAYMSPESFENMQTETSGEFGGLGIEVSMEAGVVKVISPLDDSPAYEAGVKAGDYIVKINNIQVQGKTLNEAVEIMRGPVGSDIEITVRRKGVKKALVFNITRKIIKVSHTRELDLYLRPRKPPKLKAGKSNLGINSILVKQFDEKAESVMLYRRPISPFSYSFSSLLVYKKLCRC